MVGAAAFLAACAAGALAATFACVPDLPPDEAAAAPDGSADVTPEAAAEAAPPRCGDGIIQLDRGEQCDPGVPLAPDATSGACTADCHVVCGAALPGFLWTQNNHCYELDNQEATSLDQQAFARCQGARHVVTFASEDEYEAVVGALEAGAFWVGLEDTFNGRNNAYTPLALFEPGWSPICTACFAHTPDAAAPLPGAPGLCIEAVSDAASWQQYPCSDAGKLHVVCEREPTGAQSERCDAGVCIDLVWTHGQKRYVYVAATKGADEAEKTCGHMGGTLVVLQSRDEREQLWHELTRMGGKVPGSFWIGLSQRGGEWIWDDDAGPDAYPSPWGEKQPGGNGSRAYLFQTLMPPAPVDTTLARNDVSATNLLPFVCQIPP